MANERKAARSAAEAGWHVSRYNISAKEPETGKTVIVNLLTGSCAEYSPLELYLMSALDEISEDHPIIGLLARRGAICNFDELAAIEAESHIGVVKAPTLGLVLCPTLGCNFPFHVYVRYNVHEGNRDQMSAIESFVEQLAKESGNEMSCVSARVVSSEPATDRESQVQLLCGAEKAEVAIDVDSSRFGPGRGAFCGANNTVGATVDHMGNLYQCGEVVGEQRFSYGTAREWDPARPLATASNRDMLTCYLNAFGATCDPECRECVWLPHCAGGCPHMRLFGEGRQCVPYRDNPEAFVLASYAKLSAAQR